MLPGKGTVKSYVAGMVGVVGATKSIFPSPSLSIPSEHCARVSGASELSVALVQSGSGVQVVAAPGVPTAGENTSIVT